MPHDKNGTILKAGDRVTLAGTIRTIDSDQPTYCNITLLADIGMEPSQDQPSENGYTMCMSARMVEKEIHALDFRGRVIQEASDLDEKIPKLNDFILGTIFKTLPAEEQDRMKRQVAAMEAYAAVLHERISAFPAS